MSDLDGAVYFKLGTDRRRKLNELARLHGKSAGQLVRELVDGYLLLHGMEPGEYVGPPGRPPAVRPSREQQ